MLIAYSKAKFKNNGNKDHSEYGNHHKDFYLCRSCV